ncbi:unnamed protein product [Haemonchus placei]|uniref:Uncharacterized protein n=1 Tax=Haemonchus placei TaxID=6290 RepID=A0A3P8B0S4_HAEPC|nr:unnamed protein product [Haemonchus placei]
MRRDEPAPRNLRAVFSTLQFGSPFTMISLEFDHTNPITLFRCSNRSYHRNWAIVFKKFSQFLFIIVAAF